MRKIQITIIIAALAALMLGLYRGEVAVILRKATLICLECIGIG